MSAVYQALTQWLYESFPPNGRYRWTCRMFHVFFEYFGGQWHIGINEELD